MSDYMTQFMNWLNQSTGNAKATPMADSGIMVDPNVNPGLQSNQAFQPTFMQQLMGYTDPKTNMQFQGSLVPGVQAFSGLGNAWLGMKNYGLAKDQFNFQKQAFNKNFDVQRNLTNSQLADRQRTRLQNDPSLMSVEEYMSKYGVK